VAPALADAIRDATGIRFTETPISRDRIYAHLARAMQKAQCGFLGSALISGRPRCV
jgi:hypothetical protein